MENATFSLAFIAGILSFFSPCILPLVPSYILCISGLSFKDFSENLDPSRAQRKIIINSLFFILGFTFVFVLMGATASLLGQLLIGFKDIIRMVGGVLIIIFGLYLMGLFRLKYLDFEHRLNFKPGSGYFGAFLVGVTFAAAWTPCIGPILGAILVLAGTKATLGGGILLLLVYSLGLAIPFMVTAVLLRLVINYLPNINRYVGIIKFISGLLLIIIGVLLLTNWFSLLVFSFS